MKNNTAESRKEIKKFANEIMYTDVRPCEVVNVVSDQTVDVRRMDTKNITAPKEFHEGGFLGHFSDNHNQEWEYISNEDNPVIRIRWSKAKKRWQSKNGSKFSMDDKPFKFHDYNF